MILASLICCCDSFSIRLGTSLPIDLSVSETLSVVLTRACRSPTSSWIRPLILCSFSPYDFSSAATSLCTSASSSPARPSAREMASFMNDTCRRTAWPSDAAACSAPRSGSASRTATSVMAEDMSLSSCARTASMARNQNRAIGRPMVASTTIIIGLVKTAPALGAVAITGDRNAQASRAPIASHPPEAAAAIMNGWFDGFC